MYVRYQYFVCSKENCLQWGLVLGATGGNIYDNREGGRPKSKAIAQGIGQGADMIGIMNYSQDGLYDNPSQIDGELIVGEVSH